MAALFGLAGPAEAGLAAETGVLCFDVMLVLVAAFATLLLRSRIAAGAGTAIWALMALWLKPWRDFSPSPSDDPDMQSFQANFRHLAWWWVAGTAGLAVAVTRAFCTRQRGGPAQRGNADSGTAPDSATGRSSRI